MRDRIHSTSRILLVAVTVVMASIFILPAVIGSGDPPDTRVVRPRTGDPHPVAAELQDLVDTRRIRLQALRSRLESLSDADEELEVQREIQRVKLDAEIAMYEVQLRHAGSRGDLSTAEKLREVLAAYENLGRRRAPGETAAPAPGRSAEEVAP